MAWSRTTAVDRPWVSRRSSPTRKGQSQEGGVLGRGRRLEVLGLAYGEVGTSEGNWE